jgi:alpha-L-rhamnosidase
MASTTSAAVQTTNLRCEYLKDPLGIDVVKPRLSWIITSERRGERQTAYQVLVASAPTLLAQDRGDLWDSGKIASDKSVHVEYGGKPLGSKMACHWKVRVWDRDGQASPWSPPALWTMGLLRKDDWTAQWIGLEPSQPDSSDKKPDVRVLPARYLRREFQAEKKVAHATAYVCGLGFFDFYVNGQKVSDHVMDPALSDYRKAAYYVTFDVSSQLRRGVNALGVILGNGRFFAPRLVTPAPTITYGYPKLLLQLEIEYEDGSTARIVSDAQWRLTADGPIRSNNEYDGEMYDARMEMDGWAEVGFNDSKWEKPQLVSAPDGALISQMIEPMRVTQIIKPTSVSSPKPGVFLVDMGQAFYGTVRLKAAGQRGSEVRLTSAYSLLPDGMLKTADNRGAKATDVYIFKGQGEEVWNPRFKGQGFRRVQVTGFPGTPTVDNFEGLVIHTDVEPVGEFECSNPLVNRIHTAMRWGMRMFLRSAPLDPDRDERQPWMGDPAKDAESEAFNFNVAAFYTKWMSDLRRSQRADGSIPDVSMNWEWGEGVEWPSVFTIIPNWFVSFYADGRLEEINYDAMKKWCIAMRRHVQKDGTLGRTSYGDWCDAYTMDGSRTDNGATLQELVSTAYQYNNNRIIAQAARRLGRTEDEHEFSQHAEQLKAAFNKKFLDLKTNVYGSGTQCSYVLPLAFGLVPSERRDAIIANLLKDIVVTRGGHTSVGLVGMQWLLQTLSDAGLSSAAWTIVNQTTRPSWGYMLSKGATTIWERWDCDTRDPGMNSESLLILAGNADAWFYQTLAGIRDDPEKPGFQHIIIRPRLLGDLTWVKARYESMRGRIVSHWKREGGTLTMEVAIPANATATIYVPAKSVESVLESGKPATACEGVHFLRMEDDAAVFALQSGAYRFTTGFEKKIKEGDKR